MIKSLEGYVLSSSCEGFLAYYCDNDSESATVLVEAIVLLSY